MSSKNNVNPGQYTSRGSLRQGEDVIHDQEKKEYTQSNSRLKNEDDEQNFNADAPPSNIGDDDLQSRERHIPAKHKKAHK